VAGDRDDDFVTQLVSFPFRLATELLMVPNSLKALRELTEDLAATSRVVRDTIAEVASALEPLTGAVDRVANIDRAVTELHAIFFTVLERVPGGKRAMRGLPGDREIETSDS